VVGVVDVVVASGPVVVVVVAGVVVVVGTVVVVAGAVVVVGTVVVVVVVVVVGGVVDSITELELAGARRRDRDRVPGDSADDVVRVINRSDHGELITIGIIHREYHSEWRARDNGNGLVACLRCRIDGRPSDRNVRRGRHRTIGIDNGVPERCRSATISRIDTDQATVAFKRDRAGLAVAKHHRRGHGLHPQGAVATVGIGVIGDQVERCNTPGDIDVVGVRRRAGIDDRDRHRHRGCETPRVDDRDRPLVCSRSSSERRCHNDTCRFDGHPSGDARAANDREGFVVTGQVRHRELALPPAADHCGHRLCRGVLIYIDSDLADRALTTAVDNREVDDDVAVLAGRRGVHLAVIRRGAGDVGDQTVGREVGEIDRDRLLVPGGQERILRTRSRLGARSDSDA
jgi:hypothetical protein